MAYLFLAHTVNDAQQHALTRHSVKPHCHSPTTLLRVNHHLTLNPPLFNHFLPLPPFNDLPSPSTITAPLPLPFNHPLSPLLPFPSHPHPLQPHTIQINPITAEISLQLRQTRNVVIIPPTHRHHSHGSVLQEFPFQRVRVGHLFFAFYCCTQHGHMALNKYIHSAIISNIVESRVKAKNHNENRYNRRRRLRFRLIVIIVFAPPRGCRGCCRRG